MGKVSGHGGTNCYLLTKHWTWPRLTVLSSNNKTIYTMILRHLKSHEFNFPKIAVNARIPNSKYMNTKFGRSLRLPKLTKLANYLLIYVN